jgi:hypothetical protein
MVDDTQAMMQPEDWKINMSDAWQVLWWCRHLGLTKSQLEQAIAVAGPVIVDLKQYLDNQKKPGADNPPNKAPRGASHITSRNTLSRSPL